MHNQRARLNGRQVRGREIHVIIAIFERIHLGPQFSDLLIAMLMPLSHLLPLRLTAILRSELAHDGACLLWKVWRRADEHHRLDPLRLLSGYVKQGLGAEAQANGLESFDAQMVEQS